MSVDNLFIVGSCDTFFNCLADELCFKVQVRPLAL